MICARWKSTCALLGELDQRVASRGKRAICVRWLLNELERDLFLVENVGNTTGRSRFGEAIELEHHCDSVGMGKALGYWYQRSIPKYFIVAPSHGVL